MSPVSSWDGTPHTFAPQGHHLFADCEAAAEIAQARLRRVRSRRCTSGPGGAALGRSRRHRHEPGEDRCETNDPLQFCSGASPHGHVTSHRCSVTSRHVGEHHLSGMAGRRSGSGGGGGPRSAGGRVLSGPRKACPIPTARWRSARGWRGSASARFLSRPRRSHARGHGSDATPTTTRRASQRGWCHVIRGQSER